MIGSENRAFPVVMLAEDVQAVLDAKRDEALRLAGKSRSDASRMAYACEFQGFDRVYRDRDLRALPADAQAVARYVASLKTLGRRPATVGRALASIAVTLKRAGEALSTGHDAVREIVQGAAKPASRRCQKAALTIDGLTAVEPLDDGPASRSNRAILLLGFAGAFRRSELVGLDVGDLASFASASSSRSAGRRRTSWGWGRSSRSRTAPALRLAMCAPSARGSTSASMVRTSGPY